MDRRVISITGWRHKTRANREGRLATGPPETYISPRVPQIIEPALAEGAAFLLGDWLVEPGLNRLSRDGSTVQLELKAVDVLVCLAQNAGEVLSRQELIDDVWDTEFVSYNTLASRIAELRRALGDDAQHPRYIETIHKRGYRLIAAVEEVAGDDASVESFPSPGAEATVERRPYPGLAAFTEADAENFFGRGTDVVALWRRIIDRRLLAVFGPSGVGKSSLLRAGVVATAPEGWGALVCQPGEAPFLSLARALAPEFAGDADQVSQLLGFEDPDVALAVVSRWRGRWNQTLLVVDQFEELFTLNPPEVQARFIALLRRLVDAADVHVVLAMRDDFLYECHPHHELAPIFRDLTPLAPPAGKDLERALIEPAARHLFQFEDRFLVEEMVEDVVEGRGALPLLAFAVARLWELRDSERRLLTREAYQQIGGVGGALAQHAEETLASIGEERLPVVRELFRNLVTAKGTRATRTTDELLSVFGGDQRGDAHEVLNALVDARLLTSFEEEVPERGAAPRHHRVEVVHESLLASWPRLVRWQTQDAEGSQLRDELRHAAALWDQKGRPDDVLWTGASYREYLVWRERYPGGLTDTEEAFAHGMTELATRRKRRRRLMGTSMVLAALLIAAVTTGLWRRGVHEAQRAEASKLVALGRLELDNHPTAAVAFALASLERVDNPTARVFALEALWRGPTEIRIGQAGRPWRLAFSPDGRWLAVGRMNGGIELWPIDGGRPRELSAHLGKIHRLAFGPDSKVLVSAGEGDQAVRVWSVATGELIHDLDFEAVTRFRICPAQREILILTWEGDDCLVRAWPLDGGGPRTLGRRELFISDSESARFVDADPTGTWLAHGDGQTVRMVPLAAFETAPMRTLGSHDAPIDRVAIDPSGERVASADTNGQIRIWSIAEGSMASPQTLAGSEGNYRSLRFDSTGSRIASAGDDGTVRVWNLDGPPDAEPQILRPGDVLQMVDAAFHPDGQWIATGNTTGVALWPVSHGYGQVLRKKTGMITGLAIDPEEAWIATSSFVDDKIQLWPMSGTAQVSQFRFPNGAVRIAFSPARRQLIGGNNIGQTYVMSIDDGSWRQLDGFSDQVWAVAFSPDGRFAAAGGGQSEPLDGVVRVWDLETGGAEVFDAGDGKMISELQFMADGRLLAGGGGGIRLWNIDNRSFELLRPEDTDCIFFALSRDGRLLVSVGLDIDTLESTGTRLQHRENGEVRSLSSHGNQVCILALGPGGEAVVSGDATGVVRVGPASGDVPHLLLGHDGLIWDLEVTPDGGRIVSVGQDGTLRLWPMPDMGSPPFHTLPYDELLDRLRALTNLRVIEDDQSHTGYSVEAGPFPGWETVPTW